MTQLILEVKKVNYSSSFEATSYLVILTGFPYVRGGGVVYHVQHLLCCCSWSKEVCKTLSQLHFIFYVVVMMRLVCRREADLVKQRHSVH